MRKLRRLTEILAIATLVLLGHPDTAQAQLAFTPASPVTILINGPGTGATQLVTVSSASSTLNSIQISQINTTNGISWMSATVTGSNTFNINIINTTGLAANTTYSGTIRVTASTSAGTVEGTIAVNLQVGGTGVNALTASPASITFAQNSPGANQSPSQTITLLMNGSAVPAITPGSFVATVGGLNFINQQLNANGTVTLSVNGLPSVNGTYQGNLTLFTASNGSVVVPITLNIGPVAASLIANPNPVSFNVQAGGVAPTQNVNITFNSSPIVVTSIAASTTTGQSWLQPIISGNGLINVGVNASALNTGTYNGTVTVNTAQGSIALPVSLTVGGAPTLSVAPAAVNFAYQAGQATPAGQTITVTSNGAPVSFTVNSTVNSGNTQWLVVSPSNAVATTGGVGLTISVNPLGLPSGFTYQGNVRINTLGAASNPIIDVPVSLLVSNNPIVTITPNAMSFTSQVGSNPPTQSIAINSSTGQLNYSATATVTTPNNGNWLQLPTQTGVTNGTLTVSVNTQGLSAGSYAGVVNVSVPGAGNPTTTIPINLTVTVGSTLSLSPSSLNFAYQIGQNQPLNQSVNVGANNGGAIGYTATPLVNSGPQGWLLVSPQSGTAPGNFIVSINTANLGAGTYSGTVNVTPNGSTTSQPVQVTLVVSATSLLQVGQSALNFTAQQGSTTASPAFPFVGVTSTDGTPITYSATATTTVPGQSWLFVNTPPGATPSNVTITANPTGLQAGTYTGTVTINATNPTNVGNSPQTIAVSLVVTPTATLVVDKANLAFAQNVNGAAPAAQQVFVSGVGGGSIAFSAQKSTTAGGDWLSVSPTNASTPQTLTVTANGAGLLPGVYSGTILLSSPGAANSQTVNVSLNISNSPNLTVAPTALSPVSFQIGSANPQPQSISVSVQNGGSANFTAVATMSTGTGWLNVTPANGTAPGTATVTITPANLTPGTYTGGVTISVPGATNSPVTLPITLTVTPSPIIAPAIGAVQNNASFQFTAVSPGLNIYIEGSNMGPANLTTYQITGNGTLATTLAETRVLFDNVPSPIFYTSSNKISVYVPYVVAGRATTSMVVEYKGVQSAPLSLRVVNTAPGLYTLNATSTAGGNGTGQGAILNQNSTINGTANPETAGNFIQIYATGEGLTTPGGVDGAQLPPRLPLPTPNLAVGVTIGGIPVPASDIIYAGEAPGAVSGLLQVNARIPANLGTGPQQIFITVGGVPSQANVTVAVRAR